MSDSVFAEQLTAPVGTAELEIGQRFLARTADALAVTGITFGTARVFRDGGRYNVVTDGLETEPARSLTYYLAQNGNDSNDGLSAATPKRSLATLITNLNSAPPAGGVKFLLSSTAGAFTGTESFNVSVPTFPISIVCEDGGKALLASGRAGAEFTLVSGTIYKRTSHAVAGAFTFKFRNKWGAPLPFTQNVTAWASEAAVVAGLAAGEWTSLAGACYLRMHDDSIPGNLTCTMTSGNTTVYQLTTSGVDVYLKNLRIGGCGGAVKFTSSSTTSPNRFVAIDCEFFGGNSASYEVVQLVMNTGVAILRNCRADHGGKDGLNYDQTGGGSPGAYVLEINCSATGNGLLGASASNNGSTAHEFVKILRVGGLYAANYGRNCHDVQDVVSVCIGCTAGQSVSTTLDQDVGFYCGYTGTGATTMWCIDCFSLGGGSNVRDYGCLGEGSTLNLVNSARERGGVVYLQSGNSITRA